jgi:Chalcone isomerase-like
MRRLFILVLAFTLMTSTAIQAQEGAQNGAQIIAKDVAQEAAQEAPQEVAGVKLPAATMLGDKKLKLSGGFLLRYKYFFKIYVAALYLPEGIAKQNVMGEIPRRIEFHYLRSMTTAHLIEATNCTINTGRDEATVARTAQQVTDFNALYTDVKSGDVMTIDYHPDRGTTMLINNVERGTIAGREFGFALFGIWLGDSCFDPDLKKALLGTP